MKGLIKMKYWKDILEEGLSFEKAKELIHKYKLYYMTRSEMGWSSFL